MTVYSHQYEQGDETAAAATSTTVNLLASDPPVHPSPIAKITEILVTEPHVLHPPHGPIQGRAIEMTTDESYVKFDNIGHGRIASIWTEPLLDPTAPRLVIKCDDGSVWFNQELSYEHEALKAMERCTAGLGFVVPVCHDIFQKGDGAVWNMILPRLPRGAQACNAIALDKIPPLPWRARLALMNSIMPALLAGPAAGKGTNIHCLARPYFGHRGPVPRADPHLRNFPMPVDLMERLGLPMEGYVTAMAEALACMLWRVRIDGSGVEFAIASPRPAPSPLDKILFPDAWPHTVLESDAIGPHALWLFDFESCNRIGLSDFCMAQAARAFWDNDPYYPRPGSANPHDQHLWEVFRQRFLALSNDLLASSDDGVKELPEKLIQKIEQIGRGEEVKDDREEMGEMETMAEEQMA